MRQTLMLSALAAAGLAAAEATFEDTLYSSRMVKRGLDEAGNFNMCTPYPPPHNPPRAHPV